MMTVKFRNLTALLSLALSIQVLVPAQAKQDSKPDPTDAPVVVYPVVFDRNTGTKTSRETAIQAVRGVLSKVGHPVLSNTLAASTWKRLRIPVPTEDSAPTTRELIRFGKAMKARYVVGSEFDFHSRSIWVNLGPKTISTVTADIFIFDVQQKKVVYARQHIQGRSDERTDNLKLVADVLVAPIVSAVSGGPKTPQEQRAAQIAVAKALQEWVKPDGK